MSSTIQLTGGGLRSRKIDHKKPLAVYRHYDIPDLDENAAINKIASVVATGVEKEEEDEHHLQVVLNTNRPSAKNHAFIPTPDASKVISDYPDFYDASWVQPKEFIQFSQHMDENIIGCLYNLDKKDLEWIQETLKNKPVDSYPHSDTISKDLDADAVELIFSNLEKLANEKVLVALMFTLCNSTQLSGECPTLEEFQSYLEIERPDLLLEPNSIGPFLKVVYSWWKHRRFSLRHGKPVRPSLKFEEIPPGVNDSYVCFRKRDSRPVRKTRRCDTVSLDRLHRLREEFARSREILLAVSERERLRREILEVDVRVFEARIKVRRIKKLLGMPTTSADVDQSPEKAVRKKGGASGSGSRTIKLKLAPIRFRGDSAGGLASGDAAAVSVEERIKRRKVMDEREGWADLTELPHVPLPVSCPGKDFWNTNLSGRVLLAPENTPSSADFYRDRISDPQGGDETPKDYVYRRRIGRGGRVMFDRYSARNSLWNIRRSDANVDGYNRWKYDDIDYEAAQHQIVELQENAKFTMYRAFNLAPNTEQECRSLMNKPQFTDQINITPRTHLQRSLIQQAMEEKATASPAPPPNRKRGSRTSVTGAEKPVKKVKPPEAPLNPRDAAVKNLLLASQKQAQLQAASNNTQKAAATSSKSLIF